MIQTTIVFKVRPAVDQDTHRAGFEIYDGPMRAEGGVSIPKNRAGFFPDRDWANRIAAGLSSEVIDTEEAKA